MTEDTLAIALLCTASVLAALAVFILHILSSYTNIMNFTRYLSQKSKSIRRYLYQKSKRITRYLPKEINATIIHRSLIDELIENRKNLFSTYIREEVEAGLDLTTGITDNWIERTLHRDMMEQMGANRSKTEGILFDNRNNLVIRDIIFPYVDGNYFIIRYFLDFR